MSPYEFQSEDRQLAPLTVEAPHAYGALSASSADEFAIPLWPYGLREEQNKEKQASFSIRSLDSKFVALGFGMGFACLSVALASSFFGPASLLVMPAFLALPVFGSYFLLKEPAYIKMHSWGFEVQWMSFGKVAKQQTIFWKMVRRIHLDNSEPAEGEFWKSKKPRIFFETMDHVRFSLDLDHIPSGDAWQKFLQAAQRCGGLSGITIDPAIAASFENQHVEDNYTELWLETLNAAPERHRLQPLVEGTTLNNERYKIVKRIGTGGQGTAYLASDHNLDGSQVVLKEYVLPVYVDVKTRKLALDSLQHEVTVLQSLHHPNIVRCTGFFVEDHRAYLVQEYLSGSSLRLAVEKNGPAPLLLAVKLALIMVDTLAYLHSRTPKVTHRDFTPENLIYDDHGNLKLIDFTVAQDSDESDLSTAVGKQNYLPPEQFRGRATTQSDIYSMGGTIYFLLTGSDPEPLSQSQVLGKTGDVYDAFNFVLARATALELKDRYQNVEEAREELAVIEHFLTGGK